MEEPSCSVNTIKWAGVRFHHLEDDGTADRSWDFSARHCNIRRHALLHASASDLDLPARSSYGQTLIKAALNVHTLLTGLRRRAEGVCFAPFVL